MWEKILRALMVLILATPVVAFTYEVSSGETVRILLSDLEGSIIQVNTQKTYTPFYLEIQDVPVGIYILDIPKAELETIICAPTAFEVKVSGEDLSLTCIAKPTQDTVDVRLIRMYNNTTTIYDFRFEIKTIEVWYEVWSGGVEAGYYITNGVYIIEHKPRQLVSQLIVKRGQEIVWTGLMFPGQEEKVAEDLKIKFLGALDNVTYLKVYSTSDDKFYPVQAKPEVIEKIVKEYVFPKCEVEDNWIILENVNATVVYTDGTNETIDATKTTVRIRNKDIAQVICGYILNIQPVQFEVQPPQEQQPTEEKPRFIIAPKTKYYTGDVVRIVATSEFEISCTDGTYLKTKAFTKQFEEPVSCTVVLGEEVRSFTVEEKKAVQPQQPTQQQQGIQIDYRIIALILLIAAMGYFLYKKKQEEGLGKLLEQVLGKKGKKAEEKKEEKKEEEEEIEYRVKSSLEGTH